MEIGVLLCDYRKLFIELRNEDVFQKDIGFCNGIDLCQAKLLDQAPLQRAVHLLDTSLGLWRIGVNDPDIELSHGSLELRHKVLVIHRICMIHLVRGELVQIDSERKTLGDNVTFPETEYSLDALVCDERHTGQLARRVVNGDEQALLHADLCCVSSFKPIVVAAVELFHLAIAVLAFPPRMLFDLSPAFRFPEFFLDHELSDRFLAHFNLMQFQEFLLC